jgi:hypothetical protein
MSVPTRSESLFSEFCSAAGIDLHRISESALPGEARPDFSLRVGDGREVVVEVKQFDPNSEERAALAEIAKGRTTVHGGIPGDRVRKAISGAGRQLKAAARSGAPTMLVVFDAVGLGRHTDPYAILTGTRGLDVVDVSIPADPQESPVFGEPRPGPKKKMTPTSHTGISGIGVLKEHFPWPDEGRGSDPELLLLLYHNRFASAPIPIDWMCRPGVRQFVQAEDESGWIPVTGPAF